MVVSEPFRDVKFCTKIDEFFLEALWSRDSRNGSDVLVLKPFERQFLVGVQVSEMQRLMRCFNDSSGGVVLADALDEFA